MTNLALILSSSGTLFLGAIFWYYIQEVKRRRLIETVLRQKTERERLMVQIAQQIRQSLDIDDVLTTTVAEVQRFLQADRVLIYHFEPNGTGQAIYETVLPPYPKILNQRFDEEVFPTAYHQAYALGKVRQIADIEQADVEPCLAAFVKQFGVKAKLVVPIIQNAHEDEGPEAPKEGFRQSGVNSDAIAQAPVLWGLLIAHQCDRTRDWKDWEVELMKQLSTQVAIAIQQSELYNQRQQLNTQLEQRVVQRTTELATTNAALEEEVRERQHTERILRQKK
ncbi:MAG: GAF domain-containing protein [Phormidesmis sp.]